MKREYQADKGTEAGTMKHMIKRAQIDALRGERIWTKMFGREEEVWFERFFARAAPWVDTAEDGDQGFTGLAMTTFVAGRVTVMAMAEGRSGYDGWETWLFAYRHLGSSSLRVESKEIEARKKQLSSTKRTPVPRQILANSIRALTSARITQMVQTEAPAFAAEFCKGDREFSQFIADWSFRAGALVTVAIAEGKETRLVIDQIVEDAFVASGGKFEQLNGEM